MRSVKPLFSLNPCCPHCGARDRDPAGRSPSGVLRRFRCRACDRTWKDVARGTVVEEDGRLFIADLGGRILASLNETTNHPVPTKAG